MDEIVGRDAELETIEQWLDSPHPSVLALVGEAGIGKTTLWRAGIDKARDDGYRVLACSANQSETQLSFTGLRDLVDPAFDEVEAALPTPQRNALAVTLLREEPGDSPPDPAAIAVAILTTLRALASHAPVLLAVDDIQWLDRASAGPLSYAMRRLLHQPVAVLFGHRVGTGTSSSLLDQLPPERLCVIEVGPLSIGALGRLLHNRLEKTYARPTLQKLHGTAGGNPFYAVELARALDAVRRRPRPGDALPVPQTLHELIQDRLAALPTATLDALATASALSRPTLPVIESALEHDPAPALAPAVDADVVEMDGSDVRFTHPLFAAAAYGYAEARRRELHARLADVVADVEERARHLAVATEEADAAIARAIEEGAKLAFARGSPAAAAELASEARRLTPPTQPELELALTIDEVDYRFAAGDTGGAAELLDGLLAAAAPGAERARILSRRARLRHFGDDIGGSVGLLYEALGEAGDDAVLRSEIEEGLAWGLLLIRRDLPAASAHAASAARLAEARSDTRALAEALAARAVTEFVLGRDVWDESMRRALSLEDSTRVLRVLRHPSFAYGYCQSCSDELDRAREVFLDLARRAAQAGDEGSMPSILNHLALIECLAGKHETAAVYADEGFERALESGQRPTQTSILGKKALLLARRGAVDDARALARESLSRTGVPFDPARPQAAMARGGETAIWSLGFLELSLGNPAQAHGLLRPMIDALLEAGIEEPGEARSLPDEVEALIELDLLDEAETLLERYEGWARRLERPSVLAAAGRCRGALLAARGHGERALVALEQAAEAHARVPMPFDRARTLLALGSQQRRARQRRAARDTLGSALAVFEELGAELWATKARAELGRIGGRTPSAGGLTPTEQRVAELVAEGNSNKDVANELVVSVHTVEAALTSIYRKLDVRSRTEMAAKLAGARPSKH